jgi:histidinol-phosphatase (PHP family)
MKFDFHTHHERCGHAKGVIRDYIESAIHNGLDMVGISDHTPYFGSNDDRPEPGIAMAKSEFPNYVREVLDLKQEYQGKIEVLLGIEADFFPEHVEAYKSIFDQYPFDYIIGSVHQSGRVSIFNKKRWNGLTAKQKVEQKDKYYELIGDSARSGLYDILGHIDAMKGFYPEFSAIQTKVVEHTLKMVGEYDVAVEINTSGKMKTVGNWYPADDMLELALFHNVKVTFGSDAHSPERVGDDFEEVRKKLKEIGFKEWAYFRQRQRYLTAL